MNSKQRSLSSLYKWLKLLSFVSYASNGPQHYRNLFPILIHLGDKCQARSLCPLTGCFLGLLSVEEPPGPKMGPLSAEKDTWVSGRSCDDLAQPGTDPPRREELVFWKPLLEPLSCSMY